MDASLTVSGKKKTTKNLFKFRGALLFLSSNIRQAIRL